MPFTKIDSLTPIQHLVVPGIENIQRLAEQIKEAGYDVRPIFYPSVPAGEERLRIVLHSFNTRGEVSWLIQAINAASTNNTSAATPVLQQPG